MSEPASGRLRRRLTALAFLAPFCVVSLVCFAETSDVLCSDGSGHFEAAFHTGVRLWVGAAKTEDRLASRACEAKLSWDKGELVVANDVSQLDVDAFGADLGLGSPVVAFQIKRPSRQCCVDYQIYSLQKPPRLLRTITGGGTFGASDKDLDGRVEIWTSDAAAWNDFENIVIDEFDFMPTLVLRFERNRLLDVSAEFRADFDHEISNLTAQLGAMDLREFRNSDGKLASGPSIPAQQIHRLRGVKIKVLEIVWSYLYSGREAEAWQTLSDMWPVADVERIRAEIAEARLRGIHAQVDGSSLSLASGSGRTKRTSIFDTSGNKPEASRPEPILMRRPAPATLSQSEADSESLLTMLIDSAGKVRSVNLAGKARPSDQDLLGAAGDWKFVPAFKNGHPVASRLRLAVYAQR